MERKNGWGGEGIDGDGRAEIDKVAPSWPTVVTYPCRQAVPI